MVDFEEIKCDNRQRKCQLTVLRVNTIHLSDDHDNLTVMMVMLIMMIKIDDVCVDYKQL